MSSDAAPPGGPSSFRARFVVGACIDRRHESVTSLVDPNLAREFAELRASFIRRALALHRLPVANRRPQSVEALLDGGADPDAAPA